WPTPSSRSIRVAPTFPAASSKRPWSPVSDSWDGGSRVEDQCDARATSFDPLAGTLAAFGTYTVGFVARPIGGIVIGHYGDRIGRKSMLVLTLIIMGVATFGIGLLPTYAQAGPWAAVALVVLRL